MERNVFVSCALPTLGLLIRGYETYACGLQPARFSKYL